MLVDNKFDAVLRATAAFAKRAITAHQHPTAVAQLAVEGFDHARAGLADAVDRGGQHLPVSPPGVGEVVRVAAVTPGQCPPAPRQRRGPPTTQHPGHDAPAGPFDGQPAPDLASPAAHERPHFIEFQRLPALFLRPFRPQARPRRGRLLRFFLLAWQACCAPRRWRGRCCAASYAPAATGPLARIAAPFPRRQGENSPGGRRHCTGTSPGRHGGRCGESAHWRTWRNNAACKPYPKVQPSP